MTSAARARSPMSGARTELSSDGSSLHLGFQPTRPSGSLKFHSKMDSHIQNEVAQRRHPLWTMPAEGKREKTECGIFHRKRESIETLTDFTRDSGTVLIEEENFVRAAGGRGFRSVS